MMTKTNPAVLVLLLMFSAMLLVPALASAYQNKIEGSLGMGSGDSATEDFDIFGIEAGYTRYFTDITTDDSPYGAREFLQHPSYVGGGIQTGSFEAENKLNGNSSETDFFYIGAGGRYYIRGGDTATGLGVTIATGEEETDSYTGGVWAGSSDADVKQLTFSVNQYLKKDLRLEFSIADENYELGITEYDQRVISIGASTLLQDKVWLSGRLYTGEKDWELAPDEDIEGIELTAGFYPTQKVGAFLHLGKETLDIGPGEEETSVFALEGDFYFNENMHLDAMLSLINVDYSPVGGDEDYTTLDLTFGYMF